MRRYAAAAIAAVALGGGSLAAADGPPPPASYGGNGVVTTDGRTSYVAMPSARDSLLVAIDVRNGRVMRWGSVKGAFGIPFISYSVNGGGGLSPNGRTLVVGDVPNGIPHADSRFAMLRTRDFRVRSTFAVHGDFSFDALSPDGRILYLIEHIAGNDWSRYRVRAYDLPARRLLPEVVADRRERETVMRGYPVSRATSRDGSWVYTLYQKPRGALFVHALDAVHRRAVCVDLPSRKTLRTAYTLRLALAKDALLVKGHGHTLATIRLSSLAPPA